LVELLFVLALMALSLEERGYFIFNSVCALHFSFIHLLVQTQTLVGNRSSMASIHVSHCLARGKVHMVKYPVVIPSMWCSLVTWCQLDGSTSIHPLPHAAAARYNILILRDSAFRTASSLWAFIQLPRYGHLRNLRLFIQPCACQFHHMLAHLDPKS
jgi:hypothetical protein